MKEFGKNHNTKEYVQKQILDRAKAMIDFTWTPKKDLEGWRNDHTFPAGVPVKGIPYSMTEHQTNLTSFKEALKKEDFYVSGYKRDDKYPDESATMPKYGNDCSGFVSFAWGMKRMTTYEIEDSPDTIHFSLGEKELEPGDAFVKDTHTFLYVRTAENGDFICYEQTPPKTRIHPFSPYYIRKYGYKVYRLLSLVD
ncbi:hypothetical protein CLTEP_19370 [Clostridium tepidiprofundi DSM 19306]|uniref:NlpC/P60 domain-containing protein n=1 Tax=Clostridium tepidiprofundi DSM 19306 TaxID=1121338 RepID=A0A151B2Z3_9CLOT|nr:hypothetical protein [Clostridium tepidiprofundi]KYH34160.1 hypothetical protein CLTEP_19370 [Clostridium tepidiprofundi DSM 19306]